MDEHGSCIQDYDIYDELGKGGFAKVYWARLRARHGRPGLEVAIKKIDKRLLGPGLIECVNQEKHIHSKLHHPSIVKLYTCFEDSQYVYMVLELCENGDLQKYLKVRGKLTEAESCLLLRPVIQALEYLHNQLIVHRDLSLGNLLLTKDNDVKISDFGLAAYIFPDRKHTTMCGTPNYMPPEVATSAEHGLEVDVWSLGILLFTVLVGYSPFDHKDGVRSTLTRVVMTDVKIPLDLSPEARDLIGLMLQKNPRERIRLENVLLHRFFIKKFEPRSRPPSAFGRFNPLPPPSRCPSYDSGLASSFQTSTGSVPLSHAAFTSNSGTGRLPIINSTLRNHLYSAPASSQVPSSHACCNGGHLAANNTRRDDCSHCNPSTGHRHVCSSSSFQCRQTHPQIPIPPLRSARLQPIRQKTKNVIVNILGNGEVCLEFIKSKAGSDIVYEVLRISPDGLRIILYQPNRGKGVPAGSSPPPLPPTGADLILSYENIPEKYWKKYSYAAKFVDLVKTKTPKVTFYSKSAKCFLMENTPDPDFEACFYEGGKITKSGNVIKLIESNGESLTFDSSTRPCLSPRGQLMWEHFEKCMTHCKEIETTMAALSEESDDVCFPATVGRRPPEYTRVLHLSSLGNKENVSPTAPSAVNSRMIGGYETSVISTTSKAGSGSGRRKKVIKEYDTTNGGKLTQYSNGDISLQYCDGSSLMVNSTSAIVHYTKLSDTNERETVQYNETDQIPSEIRFKLAQLSEIVKELMPPAPTAR